VYSFIHSSSLILISCAVIFNACQSVVYNVEKEALCLVSNFEIIGYLEKNQEIQGRVDFDFPSRACELLQLAFSVLPVPYGLQEVLHIDSLSLDLQDPWMLHHLPWHSTILWFLLHAIENFSECYDRWTDNQLTSMQQRTSCSLTNECPFLARP
jgi:hypothetical protein